LKSTERSDDELLEFEKSEKQETGYFQIMPTRESFNIEIIENIAGSDAVNHFGSGYHLIIGKTIDTIKPIRVSVLYTQESAFKLKIGEEVRITPDENQNHEKEGFGLMYLTGSVMVDGKIKEDHILGSENLAIWAKKVELIN
jgi:hypothetical protein